VNNQAGKVIRLPKELDADHLEHLGAAMLATGGLFVEKNITEKIACRVEVEEIDAFGSAWRDGKAFSILVEAKSGHWKNQDIFALLGKKAYLGATAAVLLYRSHVAVNEKQELLTRFKNKGHRIDLVDANEALKPQTIADLCEEDETAVLERLNKIYSLQAWRYAFWTERVLLRHLVQEAKALGNIVGSLVAARELLDKLNECFFLPDCRDQALDLYDFYFKNPKLTQQMIEERRRKAPGDELRGLSSEEAFQACLYDGKVPGVQACMYLEHRARCLILKAAVDMVMMHRRVPLKPAKMKDFLLPDNFRRFMLKISCIPNLEKLAQLWQAYILGWGGFIVIDRIDEEYANIGLEVGLEPDEVEDGLRVFDQLFPIENGWHYEQSSTGIRILKFVPNAIRDLGVQRRRWIYGDERFFSKLPPLGVQDCKKWAQCGYGLLEADALPS